MPCATSDRPHLRSPKTASSRWRRPLPRLLSLFILCWVPRAHAEVARLGELEQVALRARASLAAERARVTVAEARVALAGAPLRPTLSANAEGEASPGGRLVRVADVGGGEYLVAGSRPLGSSGALTPQGRYGVTLSLASRLYDFGRTASAVRAAELGSRAAQASVQAERATVVLEVRAAYLAWLLADGTREVLRKNVEAAASLRKSLEGRVTEGVRPAGDLATLRYDETRAALDLSRADAELANARLALVHSIGVQLPESAEPDYTLLDYRASSSPTRPEPRLVALEQQRDAALANARAHGPWRAPVLSGLAEAGLRGQAGNFFPAYRIGLSLRISLLDGGVESGAQDLANAQAGELSAQMREASELSRFTRNQAQAELIAAEDRLRLAQELAELAEFAITKAKTERELGAGALEALVQARMKSAESQLEVLNARVARLRAILSLAGYASLDASAR